MSHVKDKQLRDKVESLVSTYNPKKTTDVNVKMKLLLKSDTPVYQRPRRLSPSEQQEVDKQIRQWLEEGVVKPSDSEYASPVVLVKKKDGTTRICVDFRN